MIDNYEEYLARKSLMSTVTAIVESAHKNGALRHMRVGDVRLVRDARVQDITCPMVQVVTNAKTYIVKRDETHADIATISRTT